MLIELGKRFPIHTTEGFRVLWTGSLSFICGMQAPIMTEIRTVQTGRINHYFGCNEHIAWFTVNIANIIVGDMTFCAGFQPNDFTDAKITDMRAKLQPGIGLLTSFVLVDTDSQIVKCLRVYTLSNKLSTAFIDSCEKTRSVSPEVGQLAYQEHNKQSTRKLIANAAIEFSLIP